MVDLTKQSQIFDNQRYFVSDLVISSANLKPFELKVKDVFLNYESPCKNSLPSFIEEMKKVMDADLSFPIILSPTNYILDGKHRIAKAIIEGKKTISAVRFETMPDCGIDVKE